MSAADAKISPLDRPLAITFFASFAANEKREQVTSLRSLIPKIKNTTHTLKAKLPWLKLARFGDLRNLKEGVPVERQSLRHDRNVLAISGVEVDYDREIVTVDEAVSVLRGAGLAGMVYTSPSHTDNTPRWRVLCPLSCDLSPARRVGMVERLNGLFQGALSNESFALSQSYYYGSIRNNPSHRVELIDGAFLDLRADLDATAIGKPKTEYTLSAAPTSSRAENKSKFVEAVIRNALSKVRGAGEGQKHHTLRNQAILLGGYQHAGDYSNIEAVEWLLAALPSTVKDRNAAATTALWGIERGAERPIQIPDLPPRAQPGPPAPDPDDPGYPEELVDNVVRFPTDEPQPAPKPTPSPFDGGIIDPREWTAPAPLRQWLVQDWIPLGYATGLYGDGGLGKSLLAQQLLTSTSLGSQWLGMNVAQGFAFGMMCEDDKDELHLRQEAINRHQHIGMDRLGLLRYSSRVGFDNLLMTFDPDNRGRPSPLYAEIVKYLTEYGPKLVVIDTLADTFGGDEIKRSQARQFVQGVCGNLARMFNCAVVVCAHPSAAGISSGSGTGGSTAWSNTFRSRAYLTRPPKEDGKTEDPNARLLSRMKANYAPGTAELALRFEDGCFIVVSKTGERSGIDRLMIDQIFDEIERAWDAGVPWSSEPQTKNQGRYLPLWAAIKFGAKEQDFGKLLNQWLAGGFLRAQSFDNHSKARGLRVVRRLVP